MLGLIDKQLVKKSVAKHDTDKHAKGFDTWTHLVSMLFMQLADATSLRDISNGLRKCYRKLESPGRKQGALQIEYKLAEQASQLRGLQGHLLFPTPTISYWIPWVNP